MWSGHNRCDEWVGRLVIRGALDQVLWWWRDDLTKLAATSTGTVTRFALRPGLSVTDRATPAGSPLLKR